MRTPVKLAGFGAGLAVVFALSFGLGTAVGPIGDDEPAGDDHPAGEHTATVPPAPTYPHDEHR